MTRKGRYGGRQCQSRYGRPSKTRTVRLPDEYVEYILARIFSGDARTLGEYIRSLVRADARRNGVDL